MQCKPIIGIGIPHKSAFSMAVLAAVVMANTAAAVPVMLYCTAYSSDVKSVFLKEAGNGEDGIALSVANVIELPDAPVKDGKITLFGAPGEKGARPVVAVAETGGFKSPLIVLYPAGEGSQAAYQAVTVNADTKAFARASFQLLNLSPHPVRISRDDEKIVEMESMGSHNYAPKDGIGKPLAIKIEYKSGDNWLLLSSSNWVARLDRRTLVCFQIDPLTERLVVKSVPLRLQPGR